MLRFFLPGGYQPDRLVSGLAHAVSGPDAAVAGFHFFTVNEVTRTEAWRRMWLSRVAGEA